MNLPSVRASVFRLRVLGVALSGALALAGTPSARAQDTGTLTTLYNFTNTSDGANPGTSLVQGSDGNFYGTTNTGNNGTGYGTVFRITPAGVLKTLYTFTGGKDGGKPYSILTQGSDGNFYGTTSSGGTGYGTAFKMTPAGVLTTLHTFTGGSDGRLAGRMVQGRDGNFYSTTYGDRSGNGGYGTVFKMTPAGLVTTLYTFTGGDDGANPFSELVLASDGNFYGATGYGGLGGAGTKGTGTAFQITPTGALTTIHQFLNVPDGNRPLGGLVQGSDGNFYGTNNSGGTYNNYGTVFKMTPAGDVTVLHSFTGGDDGCFPQGGLVQSKDGSFFGVTAAGGGSNDGTVFEITAAGTLTIFHTFNNSDGSLPSGRPVQGSDGNLYGLTGSGSSGGAGTVFKLAVTTHPAFFAGQAALDNGVYYLSFANFDYFGYYSFLSDPRYLYHFDLGYEYLFDAKDGDGGIYLYDFASQGFFYTSPTFPFPYLYDFSLDSVLYYYPDPKNAGRYNTDGVRYFYVFSTGQIISK